MSEARKLNNPKHTKLFTIQQNTSKKLTSTISNKSGSKRKSLISIQKTKYILGLG